MNQTSSSSLNGFDAYRVARLVVASVAPLVRRIERADRDLARQLRRAATSVALNVAEARRRRGKDRSHLFVVALGSADEVLAGMDVAAAWGYLAETELAPAAELIDRLGAILYRLAG